MRSRQRVLNSTSDLDISMAHSGEERINHSAARTDQGLSVGKQVDETSLGSVDKKQQIYTLSTQSIDQYWNRSASISGYSIRSPTIPVLTNLFFDACCRLRCGHVVILMMLTGQSRVLSQGQGAEHQSKVDSDPLSRHRWTQST